MISAFDIIGPPMVGPSSSHTAGGVRIGLVARGLLSEPPTWAGIYLHGSFAATGKGHATDRAIVAGLLGFSPDDERLPDSPAIAAQKGLIIEVHAEDLGDEVHPNTARLEVKAGHLESHQMVASSVGGGSIVVSGVDRYATSFTGSFETLLIWHTDKSGFLAKVTAILACVESNIAAIRTSRLGRGEEALAVIELDAPLESDCLGLIGRLAEVSTLRRIPRLP